MKAIWNNTVIAESNDTINIEGNDYFPSEHVKSEFLKPSDTKTNCFCKEHARYYTIEVNGKTNPDATCYYLNRY